MTRQRQVRGELPLPDEAVLVRALFDTHVGGAAFDRAILVADAAYNYEEFGYFGLSVWAVSAAWPIERVLSEKTRRARRIALFTARSLRVQGLELVPSGRAPHHDATFGFVGAEAYGRIKVTARTAEELVDRFMRATYTVEVNNHYTQDLG